MTLIAAIRQAKSYYQSYRIQIHREGERPFFFVGNKITLSTDEILAEDWQIRLG